MKKKTLLLLSLCVSGGAIAQTAERQVIGSSGASYSGASFQADYTVGETITFSGSAGTFTVNQGFQQNKITPATISEQNLDVSYSLYPNPAKDIVTLSLTTAVSFDMKLSITNLSGQVLFADTKSEKAGTGYKRELSISYFSSGMYFVNLYDDKNNLLKSIQVIKQ